MHIVFDHPIKRSKRGFAFALRVTRLIVDRGVLIAVLNAIEKAYEFFSQLPAGFDGVSLGAGPDEPIKAGG